MKKIARDKWKHFYVGIGLGAVVYGLSILYWPLKPAIAIIVASVIIVAVCYGFELLSLITGRGHYEVNDAVAGIIGGTIGLLIVLLLSHLFHFY